GTATLSALSFPLSSRASAPPAQNDAQIEESLQAFGALTPDMAANISVQREDNTPKQYALNAERPLFVGSAVKTFILAQYLKEVEAGRLAMDAQVEIGPAVWSPGSPVFIHLQGSTGAKIALEAMIAHSDNTATDVALAAV